MLHLMRWMFYGKRNSQTAEPSQGESWAFLGLLNIPNIYQKVKETITVVIIHNFNGELILRTFPFWIFSEN